MAHEQLYTCQWACTDRDLPFKVDRTPVWRNCHCDLLRSLIRFVDQVFGHDMNP